MKAANSKAIRAETTLPSPAFLLQKFLAPYNYYYYYYYYYVFIENLTRKYCFSFCTY
jgi:hypothetical protein